MSWKKIYRIPFQSRLGTQYMVYIYENTTASVSVTTLNGAGEPFVTQEDDADDIFTPIRTQTGYLRVIDEDGTLLEALMPRNNVEKHVRLYSGTWDATMTTFTDVALQWQGFLCAQAYSQPADNGMTELEFPVKSMLAALEDVDMDYSDASRHNRIGYILSRANGALLGDGVYAWDRFYFIDDIASINTDDMPALVSAFINWGTFYEDIYSKNNGYEQTCPTYYDVLERIASLYGVQFREKGDILYAVQYDRASDCVIKYMTRKQIDRTSNPIMIQPSYYTEGDISVDATKLGTIQFSINGSSINFVLGFNRFEVLIDLTENWFKLSPGYIKPTPDATVSIVCNNNYTIVVQPHQNSDSANTEVFSYVDHTVSYIELQDEGVRDIMYIEFTNDNASTYNDCVENSILNSNERYPFSKWRNSYTSGAFPVRWSEGGMLGDGIWLNLLPIASGFMYEGVIYEDIYTPSIIYRLESNLAPSFLNGYLNLNFTMNRFTWGTLNVGDEPSLRWNGDDIASDIHLYFRVRVGSKYWTGNSWSSNTSTFSITLKKSKIVSNASSFAGENLEENGYYFPVDGMSGAVQLEIFNYTIVGRDYIRTYYKQMYSVILSDMLFSFVPNTNITAADEKENKYTKIEKNGFKGTHSISSSIGTYNNNTKPFTSFIQRKSSQDFINIEEFNYTDDTSQRPEEHLLDRMSAQGQTSRKNITYRIYEAMTDMLKTIYTSGTRKFFAVDANHDWSNDEQDVKFIEVN